MGVRGKWAVQGSVILLIGSLVALLAWKIAGDSSGRHVPSAIAQGEEPVAPSFDLPLLNGEGTLSLASLRGQAVVINFWASWCGPCRDEAPVLEAAWERYRDDGLVLVGVDREDTEGDARSFIEEFALTYPNVRDAEDRLEIPYGINGFPETYFVDRRGRLVAHILGPIDELEDLEPGLKLALAP